MPSAVSKVRLATSASKLSQSVRVISRTATAVIARLKIIIRALKVRPSAVSPALRPLHFPQPPGPRCVLGQMERAVKQPGTPREDLFPETVNERARGMEQWATATTTATTLCSLGSRAAAAATAVAALFLRAAQGKLAKSFQAKASPLESAAREQRIAASIVIGGVVSKAPTARVDHRLGQHGNTRSFPGSGLSDVFYSLSFFFRFSNSAHPARTSCRIDLQWALVRSCLARQQPTNDWLPR